MLNVMLQTVIGMNPKSNVKSYFKMVILLLTKVIIFSFHSVRGYTTSKPTCVKQA